MSDTVKNSDGLLTSDEFITIANENNNENLQLQKDLAKKVYENTYASLERQYNETATSAGVAKERNLVDADTAYKLNDVKYGAEAEAMGRMGLTGSGMGEYRQAEAYAQNRADRQASYAEYDRVMREAQHKYDQDMFAISGEELKYAEGERAAIDSSFDMFIAGINNGTMTMDQIMADSYWAKLSPEQQTTVIQRSKVSDIKTRIDNGESLEDMGISVGSEYSWTDSDGNSVSLTAAQINELNTYWRAYHAGRTRDASAALLDYLEMASLGTPIDTIMAAAQANGHYDILNTIGADGKSQWDSVKSEADRIAGENKETENKTNIEDAIANGATLEDVQKMDGWNELGETEQNAYKDMIEDRDESISGVVDYIIEGANAGVDENGNPTINSLSALNSFLNGYADINGNLLSNDIKEKVISKWQSNNSEDIISSISSAKYENGKLMLDGEEINGADIAENIKNGVYGDRAGEVAEAYANAVASRIYKYSVNDIVSAYSQIKELKDITDLSEAISKLFEGVKVHDFSFKEGAKFNDWYASKAETVSNTDTIDTLNAITTKSGKLVLIGDEAYCREGSKWIRLKKMTEADIATKAEDYVKHGGDIFDAMAEEEAKENGIYGKPSSSSTVTTETDENGNRVLVFGKKK